MADKSYRTEPEKDMFGFPTGRDAIYDGDKKVGTSEPEKGFLGVGTTGARINRDSAGNETSKSTPISGNRLTFESDRVETRNRDGDLIRRDTHDRYTGRTTSEKFSPGSDVRGYGGRDVYSHDSSEEHSLPWGDLLVIGIVLVLAYFIYSGAVRWNQTPRVSENQSSGQDAMFTKPDRAQLKVQVSNFSSRPESTMVSARSDMTGHTLLNSFRKNAPEGLGNSKTDEPIRPVHVFRGAIPNAGEVQMSDSGGAPDSDQPDQQAHIFRGAIPANPSIQQGYVFRGAIQEAPPYQQDHVFMGVVPNSNFSEQSLRNPNGQGGDIQLQYQQEHAFEGAVPRSDSTQENASWTYNRRDNYEPHRQDHVFRGGNSK